MTRKPDTDEQCIPGRALFLPLALGFCVLLALGAGCHDTRIPLRTFIEMNQQAAATTQPAEAVRGWAPGPYQVGAGDVLAVTISGLAQLGVSETASVRIGQEGAILLPTVGQIQVVGQTLEQIAAKISSAYSPQYITECTVRVDVESYHPTSVLVLGEVASPGLVELRRDQRSVLQAVLRTGGPTELASDQVVLIPAADPENRQCFDIANIDGLVQAAQPDRLDDLDILWVGRRNSDFVYVQGLVGSPGVVPMMRGTGLSVLQALASVGGTNNIACPTEATLYRKADDGRTARVKIDIKRMIDGKDPDLALLPGDLLLVPHTSATRTREFIASNLVIRGGIDATFSPFTHYYFLRDRQSRGDGILDTFGRAIIGGVGEGLTSPPAAAP